jgi:hypothetical protein
MESLVGGGGNPQRNNTMCSLNNDYIMCTLYIL